MRRIVRAASLRISAGDAEPSDSSVRRRRQVSWTRSVGLKRVVSALSPKARRRDALHLRVEPLVERRRLARSRFRRKAPCAWPHFRTRLRLWRWNPIVPEVLSMQDELDPSRGLERRSFLGVAAAAFGTAALGHEPILFSSPRFGSAPHVSRVRARPSRPIARDLVRDTSRIGEDRYLHTLASFAVRLVDVPIPEMRQTSKGDGPQNFMGVNEVGDDDPFVVLHWRTGARRSRIGLHPHLYGNVVTLGLEGEAVIQNYEMVGDAGLRPQRAVRRTEGSTSRSCVRARSTSFLSRTATSTVSSRAPRARGASTSRRESARSDRRRRSTSHRRRSTPLAASTKEPGGTKRKSERLARHDRIGAR